MSDQMVNPSALFTSRAVTRRRVLSRWTVSNRTMLTLSDLPMSVGVGALSRASVSLPDATRSPGMRLSAFVISAVMPAAKYASLVSRLMLTSGMTATDLLDDTSGAVAAPAAAG